MQPENPSNNNPFIYRILDSLGIPHQVVPVNHTHDALVGQSIKLVINNTEIELSTEDLPNILRAFRDPDGTPVEDSDNLVTSGGVAAALEDKADVDHQHNQIKFTSGNQTAVVKVSKDSSNNVQIELFIEDIGESEFVRKATLNWASILNAQRAFSNPDSSPTSNSNNLVTSGGVKTALDGKQNTLTFDSTPTANSTKPVTSGGIFNALGLKVNLSDVMPELLEYDGQNAIDLDSIIADSTGIHRLCIHNTSGTHAQFDDLFFSSDGRNIHVNINSSAQISQNYYVIATIYKIDDPAHEHDVCYFIELNGIFNDGN